MEVWLKALIGAACAVIIAGGGYLGFREYQSAQLRAANVERLNQAAADRHRLAQFTPEICIRMAKETLPDKAGEPLKTKAHLKNLSDCDDLGKLDTTWRQALDMAGAF